VAVSIRVNKPLKNQRFREFFRLRHLCQPATRSDRLRLKSVRAFVPSFQDAAGS
jgi:hypothetical protein